MKRREFITLLGGAAAAWPLAAGAQQPGGMRRIALFMANYAQTDREGQARIAAFRDTLRKLGWTDGRNVAIEYRWDAGNADHAKTTAAELVREAPDVIVGIGSPPALAELHRLTSTIPIVFTQISNPVETGIVAGLAHPGGNITGFTNFESAVASKWLEVLKEVAPNIRRVAVLFGSDSAPDVAWLRTTEAVAASFGVQVTGTDVRDGIEENTIAAFASHPDGGLIVVPHPNTVANHRLIIKLAARYRVPALYPFQYFATEGGLISYGPDQIEEWRSAASYVDRILRGEKPGELPVQAPTKFELVINLKTAKALGLTVAPSLLTRADEVIE